MGQKSGGEYNVRFRKDFVCLLVLFWEGKMNAVGEGIIIGQNPWASKKKWYPGHL